MKPTTDKNLLEVIGKSIIKTDTKCTKWRGSKNTTGRPIMMIRARSSVPLIVARVLWEYCYGKIPSGQYVLHKCDNRQCLEITHLYLGDYKQNMEDMVLRDRSSAKLSAREVTLVKALFKAKNPTASKYRFVKIVAPLFKVGEHVIKAIINQKTWGVL